MMFIREDSKFETGRIKALQEERLYIQKKTFTKWVNSFLLPKARVEVKDLFTDLGDGRKLLKLLEIISGEKLAKPNSGKMRVHKIENVNKALAFLHTKVRLESIGAEDIVDGNPRLILGLIWTIILRFQIQEIQIDVDETDESSEKKSAKDALLLWCQRKTRGYPHVNIQDFTRSWRNGLGFNALIHAHRPDLINYDGLNPNNHIDSLNNAFDVAEKELGIPRLLDAEDVDITRPDEKSIITYVASYYHTFAKMKSELKGGRRIANIVGQMMDADKLKKDYEQFTTTLLDWIRNKIRELDDRKFPNSMEGIQRELLKFKEYRTVEKPPKYRERSEIEALLFAVQTKMKALGQPLYVPPEGKLVHDLERAWNELEKAEHRREVALREELLRQKRLENLAFRFDRKSILRDNYVKEMTQVLSDPQLSSSLSQTDASLKKLTAISADVLAREERFENLTVMADELVRENYHSKDRIKKREQEILEKWQNLLSLLKKHKLALTESNNLMNMLREIDAVSAEINNLEANLYSEDCGSHLLSVEDFLQKHSLLESQIASQGETIKKFSQQAQTFIGKNHKEAPLLKKGIDKLNNEYLKNKNQTNGMEAEIKARWQRSQRVIKSGEKLIHDGHPEKQDVRQRVESLKDRWQHLHELVAQKRKQLEDAILAYQYHADANEVESWMREKLPLVSSKDYGKDEPSAQALLQRHTRLESEIKAYESDIKRLDSQAEKMTKSGIAHLEMLQTSMEEPEIEDWTEEFVLVPTEEWVDEIVEQEVFKDVTEERKVFQVKALYPFSGKGIEMQKGEVLLLLQKANADWWSVRKLDGRNGFVPATYVKEIEPKIIQKSVKKKLKPEKIKVKKTVMKKQVVKKPIEKKSKTTPAKSQSKKEGQRVEERQNSINTKFEELMELAEARHHFLEDAIQLFRFYRECDDFENWMKDKERLLTTSNPKDTVEVQKKMFENFLTDLSASSRRVEEIDSMVEEFIRDKHSQLTDIRTRQKQIHDRWNRLNRLKTEKERSLEGATSVELFNRTCDEARDWMAEKLEKMDSDEIGMDMKTIQSLQRKHQNLERELAPVEEKYNRVNRLAESVKTSYPAERANVSLRQAELKDMWDRVKAKAAERKARLHDSMGRQVFNNSAKNLLVWVGEVKQALNSGEAARDVETAENLIKNHEDLYTEIMAHEDEFQDVQDLGKNILRKSPDSPDIQQTISQLQEEREAIHRGWEEKKDWLEQCLDLQMFNREADQIDSITNSHNNFLAYENLGTTLDDVESLVKRHENFLAKLQAQEDRLDKFSIMADKLIEARHQESKYIDQRRHQVFARREAVKERAEKRREMLEESRTFQQFKAEAEELSEWIQDKMKIATDESYRDLSNLERKLKKHEAFEAEISANEPWLEIVHKSGRDLISDGNFAANEVKEILQRLKHEWEELCVHAKDKGQKLQQAVGQHTYNRTLEGARSKLDELENALASTDYGSDLRSVKELQKKHLLIESEMDIWEERLEHVVSIGQDMVKEGHFDGPNIQRAAKGIGERFRKLKIPANRRRRQLEESLKLHQFNFDVDSELQWIKEHMPAASSQDIGQNLINAQNLYKKHEKLEQEIEGHQPVIEKTLDIGKALIDQKHFASPSIKSKSKELQDSWQELLSLAAKRREMLEMSLKAQQFYSDANEVETWMSEKNDFLTSTDYGKDEDAAIKLLTKHKALELELDTYSGLLKEMVCQAQRMIDDEHPDHKIISKRIQLITQQMKDLQKSGNVRRQKLIESKNRHEYFRESEDLEKWIDKQMQSALSEEYGQDYEHILVLLSKFNDYKHRVEAGSERFNQCEVLAKKLIAVESPYSEEVQSRQEQLRNAWEVLWNTIDAREQKLKAASELHRFNHDVADALSRIQEKYESIPKDVGRDLKAVQNSKKKHEGFENDVAALEGQIQVLLNDSAHLQAKYPGGNAEHIIQQQDVLLDNWDALKERMMDHSHFIENAFLLQKFLATARDLETWAQGLCAAFQAEVKVSNAAGAQLLTSEHEQLCAEIEARDQTFCNVIEDGHQLIKQKHYASDEIQEKLHQLKEIREQLITAYEKKKIYLYQLLDLYILLRDAEQLDTLSGQQEAYLAGTDFGTTVEEVNCQVKKHDAFEKVLIAQDEKVTALQMAGEKLLQQNHFESRTIRNRLNEVMKRRAKVKEIGQVRKQKLGDALLLATFRRDAAEAEAWIEEKNKSLEVEVARGEVNSIDDKVKNLKKHQAFEAELTAHDQSIAEIKQKGESLLSKRHESSIEVRRQLETLLKKWAELRKASSDRGRGLMEAQDILELNTQVDKVEAWMRDKEMMVQAGDTGNDYEHCLSLQKKLNDVDSDMKVDDSRIKNINNLADKLVRQGLSDTRAIQQRCDNLNKKWRALQGAIAAYRGKLTGALEIHAFNRDVDDTNDRINEKVGFLSVEDEGKDLQCVEALQRKQEAVEMEIQAIDSKLRQHDADARRLIQKYPDMAKFTRAKIYEVQENRRRLTDICKQRKQRLKNAHSLQAFLTEVAKLESWSDDMIKQMKSGELANSISEAQSKLQLHQERKAAINYRKEVFRAVKDSGQKLLQQNHPAKEKIQEGLQDLEEVQKKLTQVWDECQTAMEQCCKLQMFIEQAKQVEIWLASQEAFLNNDDLGDSMAGVESLIRKHDNFEKKMFAQSEKVDQFEKSTKKLLDNGHYDADAIRSRCRSICQRRDKLKENSSTRKKLLQESKQFQQFLRNVYEVDNWINEKLQIATDESYLDLTNLISKIRKHSAFEAEVTANKDRIEGIKQEGENMRNVKHFASDEIGTQLADLENFWKELLNQTALKKERLQDAYQALQFYQILDDLEKWMDEVETQLQSEDHGRDLTTVQNLLKKHQTLEVDINNHADNIEQVKEQAESFASNNHFMKDEINEKAQAVVNRYNGLHEPVQIRRENLEESLLLQQFHRDVEEELMWIGEKEALASSTDLGTSLTSVQNLQKKHQALVSEIYAHESLILAAANKGRQMIRSNHFASRDIETQIQQLHASFEHLQDIASVRTLRLQDALEAQMFYSEVTEVETWLNDKKPLLTNADVGKDEDSVEIFMKKLDGLQRDVKAFKDNIGKVEINGHKLIERGHFDSQNIQEKLASIDTQYKQLRELCEEREQRLLENREYLAFLREADKVELWIENQMAITNSDDLGKDLEHVEVLLQKFEGFLIILHSSVDRVTKVKEMEEKLLNKRYTQEVRIKNRSNEISQLWNNLVESANGRQEALQGAKEVHAFDRSASETIGWIDEKDAMLSSEEFGHDLESVQTLVRKHERFETDLAAVKEHVQALVSEARRLCHNYPNAAEHITVYKENVLEAWQQLKKNSEQRKEHLQQAEKLQAYYDEYRVLMSWINEMKALITSDELAKDVAGAEALLARHKENKTEIDARIESCNRFREKGNAIIKSGHFMADDVRDHIQHLNESFKQLLDTWEKRQDLYELNLDTQIFKQDAEQLENWLQNREPILLDDQFGDSISAVDELIRKHEDFEKTIDAQEEKLTALKRITKLEDAFQKQKASEDENRKEEAVRREQDRINAMRLKEQNRILEERRKQDGLRTLKDEPDKSSEEDGSCAPVNKFSPLRRSSVYRSASQKSVEGSKRKSPIKRVESLKLEDASKDRHSPVTRSESARLDDRFKRLKRTPSFNTRKRASFRAARNTEESHITELEGYLERKHELQSGGKRAAIRSWKNYYTVLCGQLLCFFKDKEGFEESNAAAGPVSIAQANVISATDYTKKKHVFRLQLADGSEYLFTAHTAKEMEEWINKLAFHASLPPSLQLTSYETQPVQGDTDPDQNSFTGPESSSQKLSSEETKVSEEPRHKPHHVNSSRVATGQLFSETDPSSSFVQSNHKEQSYVKVGTSPLAKHNGVDQPDYSFDSLPQTNTNLQLHHSSNTQDLEQDKTESDDDYQPNAESDSDSLENQRSRDSPSESTNLRYQKSLLEPGSAKLGRHMSLPPNTAQPATNQRHSYHAATLERPKNVSSDEGESGHQVKSKDKKRKFPSFFKKHHQ
ncbi:LOW QUALITY PROTEIN: spectrin beta chain, non-erythrocytic 1-like [Limulus polyphemus]|uniref:LOW QUALITY PROTEIN: spectrin beta chain, non-erythrocytic 1-like n=1 Tax=Limulus polyphemus TaxID=6850 RepID=A0ABM1B8M9_LIMPO|nr:LOW QUALITY PROTEIN: spectrin beta chain, non-erythrocytic 1-like [Limulus polyphemus]